MFGHSRSSLGRSWPTVAHRIHRLQQKNCSITWRMAVEWVNLAIVRMKCRISSAPVCILFHDWFLVFNWLTHVGLSRRTNDQRSVKSSRLFVVICTVHRRSTIPIWTTLTIHLSRHRRWVISRRQRSYLLQLRALPRIRIAIVRQQQQRHPPLPFHSQFMRFGLIYLKFLVLISPPSLSRFLTIRHVVLHTVLECI